MLTLWVALAIVLFGLGAIAVFGVVFARALDAADRRDLAANDHSATHAPIPLPCGRASWAGGATPPPGRAAKAHQEARG